MTDQPAEKTPHYRRPFARPACEVLLLACVLAAGLSTLAAKSGDLGGGFAAVGQFHRLPLLAAIKFHGFHPVPFAAVLAAVALVLLVQAALPRLRPDLRAATVAYAMVLLVGPVLDYRPQIDFLQMQPEDVSIIVSEEPPDVKARLDSSRFDPLLPVTWPLLAAAVLLLVWVVVTPAEERPPAAVAGGLVTALLVVGGFTLMRLLLLARGQALTYAYAQWPWQVAALWMIGQTGVAATAGAAACAHPVRSRVAAGLTAVMLIVVVVVTGGLQ